MTGIILDITSDKLKHLVKAKSPKGIHDNAIRSKNLNRLHKKTNYSLYKLHQIGRSFILFDWEFFSNELEYE